jgi:hypothetical protein
MGCETFLCPPPPPFLQLAHAHVHKFDDDLSVYSFRQNEKVMLQEPLPTFSIEPPEVQTTGPAGPPESSKATNFFLKL